MIALAVPEVERDVITCAEAGACGYVTREGSVEDIVAAVEGVARGEAACSPKIAATLLRRLGDLARTRAAASVEAHLTAREGEVVALIADGFRTSRLPGGSTSRFRP